MHCPHCSQSVKPAPLWMLHHAWHCSRCGEAYGVTTAGKTFAIPDDFLPRVPIFSHDVARRWCFYAGNRPYVYALCYPNGLPFYVGSGVKLRALAHVEEKERLKPEDYAEKHRVIDELYRASLDVWYHFFGQLNTRQEAYALENYYIDLWGLRSRGGMLTNDAPARGARFDHIEYADTKPFDAGKNDQPKIAFFSSLDYVAVSPDRLRGGYESARCEACDALGHYYRELEHLKMLCHNCGHIFVPITHRKKPPPPPPPRPTFVLGKKRKNPPIRRFIRWMRRTFGLMPKYKSKRQ